MQLEFDGKFKELRPLLIIGNIARRSTFSLIHYSISLLTTHYYLLTTPCPLLKRKARKAGRLGELIYSGRPAEAPRRIRETAARLRT